MAGQNLQRAKPRASQPLADLESAERRLHDMNALVDELAAELPPTERAAAMRAGASLVAPAFHTRLGMVRSLFAALRYKHEPTANHGLRVAMIASVWAAKRGMPIDERADLELAALLHDVGKIGIPDHVLEKTSPLSTKESAAVDCHWALGGEILRAACASPRTLSIHEYGRAWFDGSRHRLDHSGEAIPLAARMMAIVDAFDSMTTDQVYRPAMPSERAIHELFRCAQTQFDPALVAEFARLEMSEELRVDEHMARRWLAELYPQMAHDGDADIDKTELSAPNVPLFTRRLLDNMHDGVIFVDANHRVFLWNRGVERLTGIPGPSMCRRLWLPSLLSMRDESGEVISDDACPVAHALRTGVQWLRRLTISGRGRRDVSVDAHAVPVVAPDGAVQGLVLLLHDVSPEVTLEQRCQSLHEMATRDPLTQVANRAEFDQVHETFVSAHADSRRPCSLIMADIDRFKEVNDTYGHQAGDQVLQSFARLLRSMAGPGDLVARYGGEEFVVLCADCSNAVAARHAEALRRAFSEIAHPALAGRTVSASFGVTEVQPGDTPGTMLRRADRALFRAKETGRNRVVQLGIGVEPDNEQAGAWMSVAKSPSSSDAAALVAQELLSVAPLDCTLEKLRGFVADQRAEVLMSDREHVRLRFATRGSFLAAVDRVALIMDLRLSEPSFDALGERRGPASTYIQVAVLPAKRAERRRVAAADRARQLMISLRAYLMATSLDASGSANLAAQPAPEKGAE